MLAVTLHLPTIKCMTGETTEATQDQRAMLECAPRDFIFLDAYQVAVGDQLTFDDNGVTVRGLSPADYLFRGLKEELEETYGPDKHHDRYTRLRALLGDSVALEAAVKERMPLEPTALAVELHIKEFGDVSWYLANLLKLHGITLSQAVQDGIAARISDRRNLPRASEDFAIEVERLFPWFSYFGRAVPLLEAIAAIRQQTAPEAQARLSAEAGKLILTMAHVLERQFGCTYEEALVINLDKIYRRMAEGTIFDKTGGDLR